MLARRVIHAWTWPTVASSRHEVREPERRRRPGRALPSATPSRVRTRSSSWTSRPLRGSRDDAGGCASHGRPGLRAAHRRRRRACRGRDARRLRAGADKVSFNTAAVARPELLSECAEVFACRRSYAPSTRGRTDPDGAAATAPAWEVVTHGGRRPTGLDAVEWAQRAVALGAGELLVTSMDRDGTRSGFDTDLLAAISSQVRVP